MPVTIDAIKVPRIANVIIAPKFEKNGFCQDKRGNLIKQRQMQETTAWECKNWKNLQVLSWNLTEYTRVMENNKQLKVSYVIFIVIANQKYLEAHNVDII